MSEWETDVDLGLAAQRLGRKIMEMYDKAGIATSSDAGFGPNYDATFIGSVIVDAQDFCTLDPQKIIDEAERIRRVWLALTSDDHALADIEQARSVLAVNWHGKAADRFHDQLVFIREYLEDHAQFAERAVLALGMVLAVACKVRRNFRELADAMVVACEQEIAAQETRTAEADLKRSTAVINSVLDLVGSSRFELVNNGIQSVVNLTAVELENDLKASGAPQVVEAYLRARDALRVDFEDAMGQIEQRLNRETDGMSEASGALLQPLPAAYSPSSPDFRYEHFASGYRPSEQFGTKVKQHQQITERAPDPDSPVSRRLDAV